MVWDEEQLIKRWQTLGVDDTLAVQRHVTLTLQDSFSDTSLAALRADDALPRVTMAPKPDERAEVAEEFLSVSLLGEGGMGRVMLAHQRSLKRDVAIKTVHDSAQEAARDALITEARVMANLAHPGVVPVHQLGLGADDQPVLVLKRVDGEPWSALVHDDQHPFWEHWDHGARDHFEVHLQILQRVCEAVHFAHSQGVVHRDIKPENVLLGRYGEVYLVDWGVATLLSSNGSKSLVGTPGYMAPEMALCSTIDERTDVYLLGATLHELLTGSCRHQGELLQELLLGAVASVPYIYSSDTPTELAELCNTATSPVSDERPSSAIAFRNAIAAHLRHRGSMALADAARARLNEAFAVLSAKEDSIDGRTARALRLAGESEFGFQRALEDWPDNPEALIGCESCRELYLRAALLRRNLPEARAQLDAMLNAPEKLRLDVDGLANELEREQKKIADLEALARDEDPFIGVGVRTAAFGASIILSFVTFLVLALNPQIMLDEHWHHLCFDVAAVLLAIAFVALKRKTLLRNKFNERVAALLVAGTSLLIVNRIAGMLLGIDVGSVAVFNLISLGTIFLASGIAVLPWFRWGAAVFATGALVVTQVPIHYVPAAFSLVLTLAFGASLLARRQRLKRTDPRDHKHHT